MYTLPGPGIFRFRREHSSRRQFCNDWTHHLLTSPVTPNKNGPFPFLLEILFLPILGTAFTRKLRQGQRCKDSDWWQGDMIIWSMICIAESCCRCLNERETNISGMKRRDLGIGVIKTAMDETLLTERDKQAWQRASHITLTWILVTWWPYWAVVGTLATISVSSSLNTGALSLTSLMLTRTITSPSPVPPEPSPSMYRV